MLENSQVSEIEHGKSLMCEDWYIMPRNRFYVRLQLIKYYKSLILHVFSFGFLVLIIVSGDKCLSIVNSPKLSYLSCFEIHSVTKDTEKINL